MKKWILLLSLALCSFGASVASANTVDQITDWALIKELQSVPQGASDYQLWKHNVENYLASASVEFYSIESIYRTSKEKRAEIVAMIGPQFIDVLLEQVVKYFPFTEPSVVGSQGYFWKREPIYSFAGIHPDDVRRVQQVALKHREWDDLLQWLSGSPTYGSLMASPDSQARKGAVSTMLVKVLLELQMPFQKWGRSPNDTFTVLVSAHKSHHFLANPDLFAYIKNGVPLAPADLAYPQRRYYSYEDPWNWPQETNTARVKESVQVLDRIKERKAQLFAEEGL